MTRRLVPSPTSRAEARRQLLDCLSKALSPAPPSIAVAFSGGPDSTALLSALASHPMTPARLVAVHVDHGLDADSVRRAEHARRIADDASIRFVCLRPEATGTRNRGLEAAARDLRYRSLLELAEQLDLAEIWTAHHADDQAETVLLRFLQGSGLAGLAGIEPRRGPWVRPVLELSSTILHRTLAPDSTPRPVEDPNNRELRHPRNRLRHDLLPRWETSDPRLREKITRLSDTARCARDRLRALSEAAFEIRPAPWGARLDRAAWASAPASFRAVGLTVLHQVAGAPYPPRRTSRRELERQMTDPGSVRCDAGLGFTWEADSLEIRLVRPGNETPPFAYMLETAPSSLSIPELSLRLHLSCAAPMSHDHEGSVSLRAAAGSRMLVRNRRAGDRFRPPGSHHTRKLKDLLIDRKIPRIERDRLPLLEIDGTIAWVSGLGVTPGFRLRGDEQVVWRLRLQPWSEGRTPSPRESSFGSYGLDRV